MPDAETLAAGLHSILGENGCRDGRLSILHRTSNRCASTFAREIVTCRPADGTVRRFLCKYAQVTGSFDAAHRPVADLDYEAEVYRHVLRPINASHVDFLRHLQRGRHQDPGLFVHCLPKGSAHGGAFASTLDCTASRSQREEPSRCSHDFSACIRRCVLHKVGAANIANPRRRGSFLAGYDLQAF